MSLQRNLGRIITEREGELPDEKSKRSRLRMKRAKLLEVVIINRQESREGTSKCQMSITSIAIFKKQLWLLILVVANMTLGLDKTLVRRSYFSKKMSRQPKISFLFNMQTPRQSLGISLKSKRRRTN